MPSYTFKNFIPLASIFFFILCFTISKQWYYGFDIMMGMQDFMASFFIIFSLFKIINLKAFAQAYSMYDCIAKRFFFYGYLYPFIEMALGIAYATNSYPIMTNIITVVLMLISSIGVALELKKKETIPCACLGLVFKVPMTYVTLLEDLLMAGMASIMILASIV